MVQVQHHHRPSSVLESSSSCSSSGLLLHLVLHRPSGPASCSSKIFFLSRSSVMSCWPHPSSQSPPSNLPSVVLFFSRIWRLFFPEILVGFSWWKYPTSCMARTPGLHSPSILTSLWNSRYLGTGAALIFSTFFSVFYSNEFSPLKSRKNGDVSCVFPEKSGFFRFFLVFSGFFRFFRQKSIFRENARDNSFPFPRL